MWLGPSPVPPGRRALSLSPNHGPRKGGLTPRLVVLHYTAMESFGAACDRLCDPAYEVSAHWLIGEDGRCEQLVDEDQRAWHAGAGSWAEIADVNSASIGIELCNTGFHPFPEPQMTALERLLRGVMQRHGIGPVGVIGHSDMAPERKQDPGPRFDWQRLARSGLAAPAPVAKSVPLDEVRFCENLRAYGYPDAPFDALLTAFRHRFRPWAKGALSAEDVGVAANLTSTS